MNTYLHVSLSTLVHLRVAMSVQHAVILILMIKAILIFQIKAEQEQCYAETNSSYDYFASMTSYLSSRGPKIQVLKNCSAIYVWAIIRHGTRYPSKAKKFISKSNKYSYNMRDNIIANSKKKRGNLCQRDLNNLENWSSNLTEELTMELTAQGKKDMIFLAQKVKQAFPTLLESPSKDFFVFQTSDTNRTRDSAVAFTNELLGTNFTTIRGNNITEDDVFLQLYRHCPNYKKQTTFSYLFNETKKIKSSALWQKHIAEISLRLGFLQPLSHTSIKLMYNVCGYEKAWYINTKPAFCAVFTMDDLKVMEYIIDLSQYHSRGYGNALPNENLGCPLVKDMILSLSEAAKNEAQKVRGKFLFAHSETVLPTMVKLGFNKDSEPLKLRNYYKMIEKRKWKSSFFDSFASNIIAALYKCPSQNGSENVVTFHLNERPMVVPQCKSDPCTLKELQDIFQEVFDENRCGQDFCHDLPLSSTMSDTVSSPVPPSSKCFSLFFSSNVAMVLVGFLFILTNN